MYLLLVTLFIIVIMKTNGTNDTTYLLIIPCNNYYHGDLVLNIVVVLLHSLGLVLLSNNKSKQMFIINQTFLLRYLSCSEILIGISGSLLCFKNYANWIKGIYIVPTLINDFGYTLYIFIMLVILVDRFFIAYLTLKYNRYIKPKYVKITGFVVFLITLVTLIIHICNYFIIIQGLRDFLYDAYTFLLCTFPMFATLVYTYINLSAKLRSIILNPNRQNASRRNASRIPLLIIMTYIVFIVFPNILRYFYFYDTNFYYFYFCAGKIISSLQRVGFISDALIYIFLTPRCRKKLKMFWNKVFKRKHADINVANVRNIYVMQNRNVTDINNINSARRENPV